MACIFCICAGKGPEAVSAEAGLSEEEYPGSGTPWPDTNFIENLSEDMILSPKDNFYLWVYYEWLLKLEIPDHCLMWTFLVCPVARLITAGIGILI